MAGKNILWHTRYKAGIKFMVRECRACANERYRLKRKAAKRNRALELEALAAAREPEYTGSDSYLHALTG